MQRALTAACAGPDRPITSSAPDLSANGTRTSPRGGVSHQLDSRTWLWPTGCTRMERIQSRGGFIICSLVSSSSLFLPSLFGKKGVWKRESSSQRTTEKEATIKYFWTLSNLRSPTSFIPHVNRGRSSPRWRTLKRLFLRRAASFLQQEDCALSLPFLAPKLFWVQISDGVWPRVRESSLIS